MGVVKGFLTERTTRFIYISYRMMDLGRDRRRRFRSLPEALPVGLAFAG